MLIHYNIYLKKEFKVEIQKRRIIFLTDKVLRFCLLNLYSKITKLVKLLKHQKVLFHVYVSVKKFKATPTKLR